MEYIMIIFVGVVVAIFGMSIGSEVAGNFHHAHLLLNLVQKS